MAYGVTEQGFNRKRLADIKTEIESELKTTISPNLNLAPETVLGQLVGIWSERESLLWELAEHIYNSQYPGSASGVNLDNVASITGSVRRGATKSRVTTQLMYGTVGTVIPSGSVVSVDGSPDNRFVTESSATLAAGTDEEQKIVFSAVPDAGAFTLKFRGETTSSLAFNATATDVENALNALTYLSGVSVAGDFTSGFTVTFGGDDGKRDQPLIEEDTNTLTATATPVTTTITEETTGVPQATVSMSSEDTGPVSAPAETLTEIETPITGWDRTLNIEDADLGLEEETDAEFKNRRIQELGRAGAATLEALRADMLNVEDVTAAIVFENNSDTTDSEGRPPHSVDIVVQNGDEDDIAQAIFDSIAAGIGMVGDISKSVEDSQGFFHTVRFSRPSDVDIYIEIDLTTDVETFPVDGEDQVKAALVEYGADLGMGEDIIVFGSDPITSSFADVPGILDYSFRIGKTASPTLDDNVSIAAREIADIDTSRITVTVV